MFRDTFDCKDDKMWQSKTKTHVLIQILTAIETQRFVVFNLHAIFHIGFISIKKINVGNSSIDSAIKALHAKPEWNIRLHIDTLVDKCIIRRRNLHFKISFSHNSG